MGLVLQAKMRFVVRVLDVACRIRPAALQNSDVKDHSEPML
jgi:hypothetical protein